MNLINPNLIPDSYREELVSTGSVVIRDFLNLDYAEKLYRFFNEGMPQDWWYSVSCPGTENRIDFIRNYQENEEWIQKERKHSESVFNQGGFAYHFYRTSGNHCEGCYCEECDFRKWLHEEELLNFISAVGGETYTRPDTIFASRYSEGSFLSPHTDQSLGDIGFVYQLTKDWKPQWGGLLHFTDDAVKNVTFTETPTFNTLTLFYLPEGTGKWHYVSHVNSGVTHHRYAYSGWYRK
jgi:SM-20-related protein